jgi:hypothetical protein
MRHHALWLGGLGGSGRAPPMAPWLTRTPERSLAEGEAE